MCVRPFNDYVEEDDYHIDFSYYKKECAKILYGKNKKTAGMVAVQGDLFGAMSNNKHLEPIEILKKMVCLKLILKMTMYRLLILLMTFLLTILSGVCMVFQVRKNINVQ